MEWTESLKRALDYIEKHLMEDIHAEDVAKQTFISPYYFQKGFAVMTGYSLGEYIRCRRLYLAALDALSGESRVIDLAYRYGYDTPESFTRAFVRFHGVSPAKIKGNAAAIRTFLPLKIHINIQGGNEMDYTVEKLQNTAFIGFEEEFQTATSYQEIPKFWDRYCEKYCRPGAAADPAAKVVCECGVGEFGICIDDIGDGKSFHYLIAGAYHGGEVPAGMKVVHLPDVTWAKFRCTGPMPGALQSVNTKIFHEWLPGNPEYEFDGNCNIEWYAKGDTASADYESGIWLPVKKKV